MTELTPDEIKQAVDAALAAAGLTVAGEEYERLLRSYPHVRGQLATLRFAEMQNQEPAIIYPA